MPEKSRLLDNRQEAAGRADSTSSFFSIPHCLCHEVSHHRSRLFLHLIRGVGVGAERKARVVVARHTAHRFDVYAVLECERTTHIRRIFASLSRSACVRHCPAGLWVEYLLSGSAVGCPAIIFLPCILFWTIFRPVHSQTVTSTLCVSPSAFQTLQAVTEIVYLPGASPSSAISQFLRMSDSCGAL